MRKYIFCIGFLFYSGFANAGSIYDSFSSGVFGLPWGSSIEEVKKAFPNGKYTDKYGIKLFRVKDGRTLFEINRQKQEIIFGFDDLGRMKGVSASFRDEDYFLLKSKLNTLYGMEEENSKQHSGPYATWEEDDGIIISIYMQTRTFKTLTYVSIGNAKLAQPSATAKDLGF